MVLQFFIVYFVVNLAGSQSLQDYIFPERHNQDITVGLRRESLAADSLINVLNDSVYTILSDSHDMLLMERFAMSKSLWEAYRESACGCYRIMYRGQTIMMSMYYSCITALSNDRIRELKFMLYQLK